MAQINRNNETDPDMDIVYIGGSTARRQAPPKAAAPGAARRNPYLVDYSGTQRREGTRNRNVIKEMDDIHMIYGQGVPRPAEKRPGTQAKKQSPQPRPRTPGKERTRAAEALPARKQNRVESPGVQRRTAPEQRKQVTGQGSRRMVQARRRKDVLRKRIILGVIEGIVILGLLIWVFAGMNKPDTQEHIPANNAGAQKDIAPNTASAPKVQGMDAGVFGTHPQWEEDFLTVSEYSRPGEPLGEVKNIFVHYTANPKTSAAQNRSYFEQLKDTKERGASAHFIIGYEGEILQLVPMDEIAYAVMGRNEDSISIECCFLAEDGSFTQETYDSLIKLLSWLTNAYGLESEDILRHYDCGGKKCPIYYTENEDAWDRLKKDVADFKL